MERKMTCELEIIAKEKGRNLSNISRGPYDSYHQRLCDATRSDEIIIASWSGNTLPVAAGELKEVTANNPNRQIHWVYAVNRSDIPAHLWE